MLSQPNHGAVDECRRGDAKAMKPATARDAIIVYRRLQIVIAVACVSIAAAYGQQDESNHPFTNDPAAIAAGKLLYQETCQACHGEQAGGDRGPALATGSFAHGNEDDDVFQNIRTGIPGTQMPAFSALASDDIWRVIAYLRNLRGNAVATNEVVPGDAAVGETIFWGKGGCGRCHEVNGKGGVVAPDLSATGTNPAERLRRVIVDPDAASSQESRWFGPSDLRIKTRDGKEIHGIKRAEDNDTLILTDESGTLHRLNRQDIVEQNTELLMPTNYRQVLSAIEIQDVVAYLKTLKVRDLSKTGEPDPPGGLSFERIRNAQAETQNWLTYWGDYRGHHFSPLKQINPVNLGRLRVQWARQMPGKSVLEATPLVVDRTMYVSGSPGQVFALDAKSGLEIWKYERRQKVLNPYQTNPFNRGVAVMGNRIFFGTLDAAVVALDARTGRVLWETQVADTLQGYTITAAPLAIRDKVIVGVAGGEFGIRGFLDAYDAATGKRLWRFYTVPGPGEFGNDTWKGDSWKRGSGATWLTGSYDPDLNLLYWGVGNPGPDMNGEVRQGDNLFTCSAIALDAETGKLKWYYQFTPGDTHDWDANEALVLADRVIDGKNRKLIMQADRNGMFYVLDRTDGKFLFAKPYVKQTWNRGFQADGRPILEPGWQASPEGAVVFPTGVGGSNWQNPSYDPNRSWLYVVARDHGQGYRSAPVVFEEGRQYIGGAPFPAGDAAGGASQNFVLAIDTMTGEVRWRFPIVRGSFGAGVLATGGGIVFAATASGDLLAFDSGSGKPLWFFQTGATIASSPMSYSVDGKQFVAIAAGNVLYSFELGD
jgi:PQQ-dependent dehydrogenase (methanol/ethanol family)